MLDYITKIILSNEHIKHLTSRFDNFEKARFEFINLNDEEEKAHYIERFSKEIWYFRDFGEQLELMENFSDAILAYDFAEQYLMLYENIHAAKGHKSHHIQLYKSLARLYLIIGDFTAFSHYYKRLVNSLLEIISENSPFKVEPLKTLADHKLELLEQVAATNVELFQEMQRDAIKSYNQKYEEETISYPAYYMIMSLYLYVAIMHKIDCSITFIEQHQNLIAQLIDYYKNKSAELVSKQLAALLKSDHIPAAAKSFYRHYYRYIYRNEKYDNQTLRVYIASDFIDFAAERDILQTVVLPIMQEYCKEDVGVAFEFIDLRDGLELEEKLGDLALMYKVLEMSESMIKEAHPYFLLFTKETYGAEVDNIVINELYPHLAVERPLSIAHVEYLLRSKIGNYNNSILLFQKDTGLTKDAKVESFIDAVKKSTKTKNHYEYSENDLGKFARNIINGLKIAIDENYKDDEYYYIYEDAENEFRYNNRPAIGFNKEVVDVLDDIKRKPHHLHLIQGGEGSGKTMFLNKLYDALIDREYLVYVYAAKKLRRQPNEWDLITYIQERIEEFLELEPEDEYHRIDIENLKKLDAMLDNREKIIFLIDDVDEIIPLVELFSWFDEFNNIELVVTATNPDYVVKLASKGAITTYLPPLHWDDFPQFVSGNFKLHGKTIDISLLDNLNKKFKTRTENINRLYLGTLISDLFYRDKEEYKKIYEKNKGDEHKFLAAINKHQQKIINDFPLSLNEYTQKKLRAFIKKDKTNALLITHLAWAGLAGVSLESANELLKSNAAERLLPSFFALKFALGNLVEVENGNYARITKKFVIKEIFKLIDPEVIEQLAFMGMSDVSEANRMRYYQGATYLGISNGLLEDYDHENGIGQSIILKAIMENVADDNIINKAIEDPDTDFICTGTLHLFEQVYLNYYKKDSKTSAEGYLFLARILHEFEKALPYEEYYSEDVFDYYAILGTHLCNALPYGEYEEYIPKLFDFVFNYSDYFHLDSPHTYHFLKALSASAPKLKDGEELKNKLFKTYANKLSGKKRNFLEADLAALEFFYTNLKNSTEGTKYLNKYIELYNLEYTNTFESKNILKQIDYLNFIANACLERGLPSKALEYFLLLYDALNYEKIKHPLTENLVEIRLRTAKHLADLYLASLLNMLENNPNIITNESEEFTLMLEFAEEVIHETIFIAQNMFAANKTKITLPNYNASIINYAIFYATFQKEFPRAIFAVTQSLEQSLKLAYNGIYDHTNFIFLLLYGQIIMDYAKNNYTNMATFINEYIAIITGQNPKQSKIDFENAINKVKEHYQFFNVEKSAELSELQTKIAELIQYLRKLSV